MSQTQIVNIAKLQKSKYEAKKKYVKPYIELIYLDNEISLALESTPPLGPNEDFSEQFNNTDFYSTNKCT